MKECVPHAAMPGIRLSILVIVCAFLGCSSTIDLAHADNYRDRRLEVVTISNVKYQIASGWTTDSLHGIAGRGLMSVGDSTKVFHGTIPAEEIEHLSVQDDLNPTLLIISAALAISFLIYLRS